MKIVRDNEVMKIGDYVVGFGFSNGCASVDGFAGSVPTEICGYEDGFTIVVRVGEKEKKFLPIVRIFGKLLRKLWFYSNNEEEK